MTKETRTIRPFVGLGALVDVLSGAVLYFGRESCLANRSMAVDLTPHEFLLRPVSLEWASDTEAFEGFKHRISEGARNAGLTLDDLALVIIGTTSFLKVADVVFHWRAAELGVLRRVVPLTEKTKPMAFAAPFSGFTVDAYLLLDRSLTSKPLRPHLQGTWVAWAQFRIETTQSPALLAPTPLTDEVRQRHRLPARTMRYLYFGDHDVLEPYAQQEQPVFYIDEKVLAQMNAQRRTPGSKALQLQVALDFVSVVIRRASGNSKLSQLAYEDLRSSLFGSVVRIAAGPGATDEDRERLTSEARDNPDHVIARAEHFIDVASGYGELLKDGKE